MHRLVRAETLSATRRTTLGRCPRRRTARCLALVRRTGGVGRGKSQRRRFGSHGRMSGGGMRWVIQEQQFLLLARNEPSGRSWTTRRLATELAEDPKLPVLQLRQFAWDSRDALMRTSSCRSRLCLLWSSCREVFLRPLRIIAGIHCAGSTSVEWFVVILENSRPSL